MTEKEAKQLQDQCDANRHKGISRFKDPLEDLAAVDQTYKCVMAPRIAVEHRNQDIHDLKEMVRDGKFPEINLTERRTKTVQTMNKTERARYDYLAMLRMPKLRAKAFSILLADDTRFFPDISYVDPNGRMVLEDVKGSKKMKDGTPGYWTEEDAKIKIKVAAREYNEFRFLVVYKANGNWVEKEISP